MQLHRYQNLYISMQSLNNYTPIFIYYTRMTWSYFSDLCIQYTYNTPFHDLSATSDISVRYC